ncbi:MAG: ATP-binding cassette domain-containing protein, partial [Muribaculaceae bacterium]|nr:ATP-binding cassette domain-containing protein [Muribaculaceae bacterium]
MKKEETVKIINLDTGYSDRKNRTVITSDINASLYSRELTCLLGPNGAGKSTLLKTLTSFLPPLKGDIIIEGRPLNAYSETDMANVIGYVLTERHSNDNKSV